jgi:flagellar biosynthesis regulator FlbT
MKAFNTLAERLGYQMLQPVTNKFYGRHNDEIFMAIAPQWVIDKYGLQYLSDEKEAIYRELYAGHVCLTDGLEELIADAKSKKSKQVEDPTTAPIVNFMNGIVDKKVKDSSKLANTLCNTEKSIVYKEYSKLKETNKKDNLVIDLKRFEGIEQAKRAYIAITEENKNIESEDEKFNASAITACVDEPITRGYLSMAETRFVEPKKRTKKVKDEESKSEDVEEPSEPSAEPSEELVSDRLDRAIKTLGLPKTHNYCIKDFINSINSYVNDVDKFKIRAFNKSFPLALHKEEEDSGHVNSKWQQHYIPHFDELLSFIVENIDDADVRYKALSLAHNLYATEFEKKNQNPASFASVLQVKTFLTRFATPEELFNMLKAYTAHKKGVNDDVNELTIKKDVKAMQLMTKKNAKQFVLDSSKTIGGEKLEKDIFELIAMMRKCLGFINTVLEGKEYFERKTGSDPDYASYYARYQEFCAQHEEFVDTHADVPETIEGLIIYMVQAIVFFSKFKSESKDKITYITPKEFETGNVTFKIDVKLNKKLKEFYTLEDEQIPDAVTKLLATDEFKNIVETQDLSKVGAIAVIKDEASKNADIFAKIGQIANTIKDVAINKNTRIALGLAIIKYILIETDRILALESGKKSTTTIYIKY